MTKTSKTVIILLSVTIIGLIWAIFALYNANIVLSRNLRYNTDHAFAELVSCFDDLTVSLSKCRYADGGNVMAGLCADTYAKSQAAQMALGVVPYEEDALSDIADFISKVGDYSYAIACGMVGGDVYENLSSLSDYAETMTERLHAYAGGEDTSVFVFSDDFKDTEKENPEMPTLIYDGPFSDDVDAGSYSMLDGLEDMSEEEIIKSVADKTGLTGLACVGKIDGALPCCVLESGNTRITATIRGGLVMTMKTDAVCACENIERDEATIKAADFLAGYGYVSMVPTYTIVQDNAILINFAYKDGDYICYPDLIKVRVSLDDGCVLDMDASGYFRNHKERTIPKEVKTMDECRACVPSSLKILSEGRAVIPTYGKKEKPCFEFKCENENGRHYIIYADTQSGAQADILQLIEDENGILTK